MPIDQDAHVVCTEHLRPERINHHAKDATTSTTPTATAQAGREPEALDLHPLRIIARRCWRIVLGSPGRQPPRVGRIPGGAAARPSA